MTDETKSISESGELPRAIQLAGCIIQNPAGKILVIHRKTRERLTPDKSGDARWEEVGGKQDDEDSTLEAAAKREALEELGIEVETQGILAECDFEENGNSYHYTSHRAVIISEEPTIMEPAKFDQFAYKSWEELRTIRNELSNNLRVLVDSYFAGKLNLT